MSRQRDYQPTIDRQRLQIVDVKRQLTEQRRLAKEALRDVAHMRFALQDADAENERLRFALLVQDSLVAGLRADLAAEVEKIDQLQRLVVELSKPAEPEPSWFRMWLGSIRPTVTSKAR